MSNTSRQHIGENSENIEKLFQKFVFLNRSALKRKISYEEIEKISGRGTCGNKRRRKNPGWIAYMYVVSIAFLLACLGIGTFLNKSRILESLVETTLGVRCVIPNNYFVWEATRPITDCNICANITAVYELTDRSRESFSEFAYSSRPVVVRGAALDWPATSFNFKFFKDLFSDIPGSYESIEEDCQFLSFKTEFLSLRDVFNMTDDRINGRAGTKPWYIGWSVCHGEMVRRMREHYPRPSFLPVDAEHSHLDYVFMGYQQGAVMHLDYISRLMWQAQLVGRKTWDLVPPPECDHVCSSLSVTVEQGDIIVLDTRQWYHDTHVEPGVFSLTVSSEYG